MNNFGFANMNLQNNINIFNHAFYNELVSANAMDEIRNLRRPESEISFYQREQAATVFAYANYAMERGFDIGKISVNKPYLLNPETGQYYKADLFLEYKQKKADFEADGGDHEDRIEEDMSRDIKTKDDNTYVGRWRVPKCGKLKTSKCYITGSKHFTIKNKKEIIEELNNFYCFVFDSEVILDYITNKKIYIPKYFLLEEEIAEIYKRNNLYLSITKKIITSDKTLRSKTVCL